MGEIELTDMQLRQPDAHTALASSQEGIQDGGRSNGNGHIHHESEAFIRDYEDPVSDIVLGNQKRRWWVLIVIVFLVIVLAVAIFVGVYFSVSDSSVQSLPHWNFTNITVYPKRIPTVEKPPPPKIPKIAVNSFRSNWDPGDSKVFEVTFTNGTTLKVFGEKDSDGSLLTLRSLTIEDIDGVQTKIKFKGGNNFASVLLPDGSIVNYESSDSFLSLECRIFLVPKFGKTKPLAYVSSVYLDQYKPVLVRVSEALSAVLQPLTNISRAGCPSRLPLRVTKCGGKYPYDGAFVTGSLTHENGDQIFIEALPWSSHPNCFKYNKTDELPNYFLPLPPLSNGSESLKEPFCASAPKLLTRLCSQIGGTPSKIDSVLCSYMTHKLQSMLPQRETYSYIYRSCYDIFNSLRLACASLGYSKMADKAVYFENFSLNESIIHEGMCRDEHSFGNFIPTETDKIRVTHYCPSVSPGSSFDQIIHLNQINSLKNMIHINCPARPELTHFYLWHAFTGATASSPALDRVKHRLRVCSICSLDLSVGVRVLRDEMCCNNTCAGEDVCEIGPDRPNEEVIKYDQQKSVYCHDFFLENYINQMFPVERKCISDCDMKFDVDFKLYNSESLQTYYHQTLKCWESGKKSCKNIFGT